MNNYNSLEIFKKIELELQKIGKKPASASTEIGLSKNAIAAFKNSVPKADTLARIADYLGCSVDYLLGRPADGITAEERQLLEHFRACSVDDKKYIRRLASTFAAEEVAEKAKREG